MEVFDHNVGAEQEVKNDHNEQVNNYVGAAADTNALGNIGGEVRTNDADSGSS